MASDRVSSWSKEGGEAHHVVTGYLPFTMTCAPLGKSDGWTMRQFLRARVSFGVPTTA